MDSGKLSFSMTTVRMSDAEFRAELVRMRELRREHMILRRRRRKELREHIATHPLTLGQTLWLPFGILWATPSVLMDCYWRRQALRLTRDTMRMRRILREAGGM
ncbi:MAG: hypothetical protein AMXMBFR7_49090 [Planctomycetota bacterium]